MQFDIKQCGNIYKQQLQHILKMLKMLHSVSEYAPISVNNSERMRVYVRLSSITVASPNGLDGSSTFSSTTTTSSTTVRLPSGATTERAPTNEVYLWLPLIVVVIFTGIMVTLIMVGRRGEENPYDQTSGTNSYSVWIAIVELERFSAKV